MLQESNTSFNFSEVVCVFGISFSGSLSIQTVFELCSTAGESCLGNATHLLRKLYMFASAQLEGVLDNV